MFILNEEIKEQERQAIRELYPKFPDTQVIVTYTKTGFRFTNNWQLLFLYNQ